MLVSESKTIEKIIAGKIKLDTSTKKSLDIDLASELSLWINTTGLKNNLTKIKHPAAGAISGVVGMFDSIKASINNNDLTLGFKCANQETAENLKTFLEGQVAGYKMFISSQLNNQKLPDKEPKWLPKAFKALFARAMALSARQTLNATKITQKNLEIYLTSTLPPLSGLLLNPATIATTGALAAIAIPNFQKARKIAKQKKCFANQRKIAAAIKKYNNDNENKLRTLDDKVLNTLIEKGYLKKYPTCSDNGKYRSLGDISAEGVINCTRHGSVEMK
jgi:competence protein ComGC